MYILEYMIGYRQIQQHYIQQHKGKSFKCIILHATGTQQPLGTALGRHVTLKYEAATYLCSYNLWGQLQVSSVSPETRGHLQGVEVVHRDGGIHECTPGSV